MNIGTSALVLATMTYNYTDNTTTNILVGFATLLAMLNMVRYFEFAPQFYVRERLHLFIHDRSSPGAGVLTNR